jgi:lysophospholipase L1-like esterase
MRHRFEWLRLGLFFVAGTVVAQVPERTVPFASAIAAFEAQDATNPPPRNAVLFVGSSSIRRWETLAQDFPFTPVINRGFGGSTMAHVVHYADRIVLPYRPRLVVVYAGDNDLNSGKTPETLLTDFQAFVGKVPEIPIVFLAIKPSPKRWALVEKTRVANRLIREFCATEPRLRYVDTFTPMLGADGQPRPELYAPDQLHPSRAGYQLWQSILTPYLHRDSSPAGEANR